MCRKILRRRQTQINKAVKVIISGSYCILPYKEENISESLKRNDVKIPLSKRTALYHGFDGITLKIYKLARVTDKVLQEGDSLANIVSELVELSIICPLQMLRVLLRELSAENYETSQDKGTQLAFVKCGDLYCGYIPTARDADFENNLLGNLVTVQKDSTM